ncbi:MAG: hypothetical protein ACRDTD_33745, partial [Pseudonocardiaceae bacterium]
MLLLASESGVDVRLEVLAGVAGNPAMVSDNPMRRSGPQRILVPAGPARRLSMEFIGKDGVRGRVHLSAFALAGPPIAGPCVAAQRALADGDASFARAQLISMGLAEAPAGSALREYEAAAHAYQRAVLAVEQLGPNLILAQAQLSAAAVLYQGVQNWAEALRVAQLAQETYSALGEHHGRDRAQAMAAAAEMEVALGVLAAAPNDPAAEQRMNGMLAQARQSLID